MFVKKIIKHGNSLALIIPIQIIRHYDLKRGDFCVVSVDGENDIVIQKFDPVRRPDLAELVDKELPVIEGDRCHHELL